MVRTYYVRMTSKGRITIPVEARRALGLKPGDLVLFQFEPGSKRATMERVDSEADAAERVKATAAAVGRQPANQRREA